jgi:hypothetical protein
MSYVRPSFYEDLTKTDYEFTFRSAMNVGVFGLFTFVKI